jgi:hypothetical protein
MARKTVLADNFKMGMRFGAASWLGVFAMIGALQCMPQSEFHSPQSGNLVL